MPEVAALLDDLRHRQLAACLSGARPSILAFERDGHVVDEPPDGLARDPAGRACHGRGGRRRGLSQAAQRPVLTAAARPSTCSTREINRGDVSA